MGDFLRDLTTPSQLVLAVTSCIVAILALTALLAVLTAGVYIAAAPLTTGQRARIVACASVPVIGYLIVTSRRVGWSVAHLIDGSVSAWWIIVAVAPIVCGGVICWRILHD